MQTFPDHKVPPGGYWVVLEGERLEAGELGILVTKVRDKLISLDRDIPLDIDAYVKDLICQRVPANCQMCKPVNTSPRKIGLKDVKRFVITMGEWTKKGFGFVDIEEANRRAAICVGCPENVTVEGCWGCRGIAGLVNKIGKPDTEYDNRLKHCNVCGCMNAVQIHFPMDVLQKTHTGVTYPDHCWKKPCIDTPK
jgi:hypothetical protein